jgi:hypothetical protein
VKPPPIPIRIAILFSALNHRRLWAIFLARNKPPMANTVKVNQNGPSFSPTTELQTRKISSSKNSIWTVLTMIIASSILIRGPTYSTQRQGLLVPKFAVSGLSMLSFESNYSTALNNQAPKLYELA